MTPRQTKLVNAAEAVETAKNRLEADWPLSDLNDPMMSQAKRDLYRARHADVASLDLASKTVMAVAADPEAFGKVMELRAKKPADFQAIMVLVQIELERPAPAEEQVAA